MVGRGNSVRSDTKVRGTQCVLEPHIAPGVWKAKGDVWSGSSCSWGLEGSLGCQGAQTVP